MEWPSPLLHALAVVLVACVSCPVCTAIAVSDTLAIPVDSQSQAGDIVANLTSLLNESPVENASLCSGTLHNTVAWYRDPGTVAVTSLFTIDTSSSVGDALIVLNTDLWSSVIPVSSNVTAIIVMETSLEGVCSVTLATGDCVRSGNRTLAVQSYTVVFVFTAANHRPQFSMAAYTGWLAEDQVAGTVVQGLYNVQATDEDPSTVFSYRLTGNASSLFKVSRVHLGSDYHVVGLTTVAVLSHRQHNVLALGLVAEDNGDPVMSASATIHVSVLDINNSPPVFKTPSYAASVAENATVGTSVLSLSVTDNDVGRNAEVYFSLEQPPPGSDSELPFACNPWSGEVFIAAALDYERSAFYSFTVLARDRTSRTLASGTQVNVTILDVNEHPPLIQVPSQYITVMENVSMGTRLAEVYISDGDIMDLQSVSVQLLLNDVISELVVVRQPVLATSGQLSVAIVTNATSLNRELYPADGGFVLDVVASDGVHQSHLPLYVMLVDVNDELPLLADTVVSVTELVLNGTTLTVLRASDPDNLNSAVDSLTYSIVSGNGLLWLDLVPLAGNQVAVVTADVLDHEVSDHLLLNVSVFDGKFTTYGTLTVNIIDANDHSPQFSVPTPEGMSVNITDEKAIGQSVITLSASDDDTGANARIQYTLVSYSEDFFSVNRYTGDVTVSRSLNTTLLPSSIQLLVRASDQGLPFPQHQDAELTVFVEKVIERLPVVVPDVYQCYMRVDRLIGDVCTQVYGRSATATGSVTYQLVAQGGADDGSSRFKVNAGTGVVSTSRLLVPRSRYRLTVSVTDTASTLVTLASVHVTTLDENSATPVFSGNTTITVSRYTRPGALVGKVDASDADPGLNGVVTFRLVSSNPRQTVTLDGLTGEVYLSTATATPLPTGDIVAVVEAEDQGGGSARRSATITYTVRIVEGNRAPVFPQPVYAVSVAIATSSTTPGTKLLSLAATDGDAGPAGTVTYSIASNQYFNISKLGELVIGSSIPSQLATYSLTVFARDQGSPQLEANVSVVVTTYPGASTPCANRVLSVREGTNETVQDWPVSGSPTSLQYSLSTVGSDTNVVTLFSIDSSRPALVLRHADRAVRQWYIVQVNTTSSARSWSLCPLLVIVSEAVNSHPPQLAASYDRVLPAYAPIGSRVLQVNAVDPDGDDITYMQSGGNATGYIQLDSSGLVTVFSTRITAVTGVLVINFQAVSKNAPNQTAQSLLSVSIRHYQVAGFSIAPSAAITVPSNAAVGQVFGRANVAASLPALLHTTPVTFSISADSSRGLFSINSSTGELSVGQALPAFPVRPLLLTVQASLEILNIQVAAYTFNISVGRSNHYAPVFYWSTYVFNVTSSVPRTTVIDQLSASDGDAGQYGRVEYRLYPSAASSMPFAVSADGNISVTAALDQAAYVFMVIAYDTPGSVAEQRTSRPVNVEINVVLANENTPVLSLSPRARFTEETVVGTSFLPLVASDADSGTNGQLVYALEGTSLFSISPLTGVITVAARLDVDDDESESSIMASVFVTDLGSPPRSVSKPIVITVLDSNDKPPVFAQPLISLTVNSTARIGAPLHTVSTSDRDATLVNREVTYDLSGAQAYLGLVTINYFTGEMLAGVDFSAYASGQFALQVNARNGIQLSSAAVSIQVRPGAAPAPRCEPAVVSVTVSADFQAGMLAASLHCTGAALEDSYITGDAVALSALQWSASSASLLLSAAAIPRVDTTRVLSVSIVRNDSSDGLQTLSAISVLVRPINSNYHRPRFQPTDFYTLSLAATTPIGTVVGFVNATDEDTVDSGVTYSAIGGSGLGVFDVMSRTGAVILTGAIDQAVPGTTLNVTVSATDSSPVPLSASAFLLIKLTNVTSSPSPVFTRAMYNWSTPEYSTASVDSTPCMATTDPFLGAVFTLDRSRNNPDHFTNIVLTNNSTAMSGVNVSMATERNTALFSAVGVVDTAVDDQIWLSVHSSSTDGGSSDALLLVSVEDTLNQYHPTCLPATLSTKVLHSALVNSTLLQVIAVDLDHGSNGRLSYSLAGSGNVEFRIGKESGVMSARAPLNIGGVYNVTVDVTDAGVPALAVTCQTQLTVLTPPAISGLPPSLRSRYDVFSVPETAEVGTIVGELDILERDADVMCTIATSDPDFPFATLPNQPKLILARKLDFERTRGYNFSVQCANRFGNNGGNVVVNVRDANDNAPVMSSDHYMFFAGTNDTNATEVGRIHATDVDTNDPVSFHMNSTLVAGVSFALDGPTGVLSVREMPSFARNYTMSVCACDQAGCTAGHMTCSLVTVIVERVDVNPPRFTEDIYQAAVQENSLQGTSVVRLHAYDGDVGNGGRLAYSVQSSCTAFGNDSVDTLPFLIDPVSGVVSVNGSLDAELTDSYQFAAVARDSAGPAQSACATVVVSISNAPDVPPEFPQAHYTFNVSENVAQPHSIGTATCTSYESTVSYTLSATDGALHPFSIQRYSGVIALMGTLDRELVDRYLLTVVATDQFGFSGQANVTVHVLDVNDVIPLFSSSALVASIAESAAVGSLVIAATAVDTDLGSNGRLTYSILTQGHGNTSYLSINTSTGYVYLARQLLTEELSSLQAVLAVQDGGRSYLASTALLRVTILDANEHAPMFLPSPQYTVNAVLPVVQGTVLLTLKVADNDATHRLAFSIVSGDESQRFAVGLTGQLVIQRSYNLSSQYTLGLEVSDGMFVANASVVVTFTNSSARDLLFNQTIPYVVTIAESRPVNSTVFRVAAVDYVTSDPRPVLHYSLLSETATFTIDALTGQIVTAATLDYETQRLYALHVQVRDSAEIARIDQTVVVIRLSDINDNAPAFLPSSYVVPVLSNTSISTVVYTVEATDADSGSNGEVRYTIVSGNDEGVFSLSLTSGQVSVAKQLRVLLTNSFSLTIEAQDNGVPHLSRRQALNITVERVGLPIFTRLPYRASLLENLTVSSTVITVTAESPFQDGRALSYSLEQGNEASKFFMEPTRGVLLLVNVLDYEQQRSYQLTVRATDQIGLYAEQTVDIAVRDVNDRMPVFVHSRYTATISEIVGIGSTVLHASATDDDSGLFGNVTYTFDSTSVYLPFSIDPYSGAVTTTAMLDFSNASRYEWLIVASDHGIPPLSSRVAAIVNVMNVNNHPPVFTAPRYTATVDENAAFGFVVVAALATDLDGTLNALTYSIVSGGSGLYAIQANAGTITVARSLFTTSLLETLNISVSDGTFSDFALVRIRIHEINTFAPVFNMSTFSFAVNETQTGAVGRVAAYDRDFGRFGVLTFTLGASLDASLFSIGASTGVLSLDSDTAFSNSGRNIYEAFVIAEDAGKLRDQAKVIVTILDINDCQPTFASGPVAYFTISATLPPNTFFTKLLVSDCDAGSNARITYSIGGTSPNVSLFAVDSVTGGLRVGATPPRKDSHLVRVRAEDNGLPSLFSILQVNITVAADPSTVKPIFNQTHYTIELPEDAAIGTTVLQVHATVLNASNLPIIYSFSTSVVPASLRLAINQSTGLIYTFSTLPSHTLVNPAGVRLMVKAQDSKHQESEAPVTVKILPPLISTCPFYSGTVLKGTVLENEPQGTLVAVDYTVSSPTNHDVLQSVEYVLTNSSAPFAIYGPRLLTAQVFDFERQSQYNIVVQAVLPNNTVCIKPFSNGIKVTSPVATVPVVITIIDTNDSPPRFTKDLYQGFISEDSVLSATVNITNGPITATDADSISPPPRFIIVSGNADDLSQSAAFRIDSYSGAIYVAGVLDYELKSRYLLNISVSDGRFSSLTSVQISILDSNDNTPRFSSPEYSAEVAENDAPGTRVTRVNATDPDSAMYGPLHYSIVQVSGSALSDFAINVSSGWIYTARTLDHEQAAAVQITVQVADGGGLRSLVLVRVTVLDSNDNAPVFSQPVYHALLVENSPIPAVLVNAVATDQDTGNNSKLTFKLLTSFNGTFALAVSSAGVVEVRKDIDREVRSSYILIVQAFDQGDPQLNSTVSVNVTVLDRNDVTPQFQPEKYEASILENATSGASVVTVTAVDNDLPENTQLRYSILSRSNGAFRLDPLTGVLSVFDKQQIDYEKTTGFNISIEVTDSGFPALSSTSFIIVNILPLNDHKPKFQPRNYNAIIPENLPAGTFVATVVAYDFDIGLGGMLTYSIDESDDNQLPFRIDNVTGVIRTTAPLDRDRQDAYVFNVSVTDDAEPVNMDTAAVVVRVRDVNDNPPVFYVPSPASEFEIAENMPGGMVITTLFANDTDIAHDKKITYEVASPKSAFHVTGDTLQATQAFDYEAQSVYDVVVTAADNGQPNLTTNITIRIVILDENDNPPTGQRQTITFNQHSYLAMDVIVGCVSVVDADTNKSALRYSIAQQKPGQYFSMVLDSCELSLSPANSIPPAAVYTVNVSISDGFHSTVTNLTVHVRSISNTSLQYSTVLTAQAITTDRLLNASFTSLTSPLSLLAAEVNRYLQLSSWRTQVYLVSVQAIGNSTVSLVLAAGGQNIMEQTMVYDVLYHNRKSLQSTTGLLLETVNVNNCQAASNCLSPGLCFIQPLFNHTTTALTLDLLTFDSLDFRAVSHQYCPSVQRLGSTATSTDTATDTDSAVAGAVQCSSEVVDACASDPCLAGGVCATAVSGSQFTCRCAAGYAGNVCQLSLEGSSVPAALHCDGISAVCPRNATVQIGQQGYLLLQRLQLDVFEIVFQFSTTSANGNLLFARNIDLSPSTAAGGRNCSGQQPDHMHVGLDDGRLVVAYQFGCNAGQLTPELVLIDAQWHTVHVRWTAQSITVQLDWCRSADDAVSATMCQHSHTFASPLCAMPRLNSPLFVGGVDTAHMHYLNNVSRASVIQHNFTGCIRQLRLGGAATPPLDFAAIQWLSARSVSLGCGLLDTPCAAMDCGDGFCQVQILQNKLTGVCSCPVSKLSLGGCKEAATVNTLPAGVRLQYQYVGNSAKRRKRQAVSSDAYSRGVSSVELRMRTYSSFGSIVVVGRVANDSQYAVLQIQRGRLQYQFHLDTSSSSPATTLSLPYRIDTGYWYTVNVLRDGRSAYLQAVSAENGTQLVRVEVGGSTSTTLSVLNTDIYLGDQGAVGGLEVCIQGRVTLDSKELPLSGNSNDFETVEARGSAGAGTVALGCAIKSCENGGLSQPGGTCICPAGYTGRRCQTDIDECASNPCPSAAVQCVDLVNEYMCRYSPVSVVGDQSPSDLISIVLIAVLAVILLLAVAIITQRIYVQRKLAKYRLRAEEAIEADAAVILARDAFHDLEGRGNVMDYHDQGGGETDLDSFHIGFDELMREKVQHDTVFAGAQQHEQALVLQQQQSYGVDERDEIPLVPLTTTAERGTAYIHDYTRENDDIFLTTGAYIVEDQTDGGFEIDVDAVLNEATASALAADELEADVDNYLQQRLDELGMEITELMVPDEVHTFEQEGTQIDDVDAAIGIQLVDSDVEQENDQLTVAQKEQEWFSPTIRNNTANNSSLMLSFSHQAAHQRNINATSPISPTSPLVGEMDVTSSTFASAPAANQLTHANTAGLERQQRANNVHFNWEQAKGDDNVYV